LDSTSSHSEIVEGHCSYYTRYITFRPSTHNYAGQDIEEDDEEVGRRRTELRKRRRELGRRWKTKKIMDPRRRELRRRSELMRRRMRKREDMKEKGPEGGEGRRTK
jgi:hypothetical protein